MQCVLLKSLQRHWLGVLALACLCGSVAAADEPSLAPEPSPYLSAQQVATSVVPPDRATAVALRHPRRADFAGEPASEEARHVARWAVHSGDHQGLPFAIVDKVQARVFVFDAQGRLRGSAPALLGLARGDDSVPGIGERPLSGIRPEERTTPAGRFVAALGRNLRGEDILWVDYDTAISMHRVIDTHPSERRPQRLASATPLDNRISYGCINVPAGFYDKVVIPAFSGTHGIVYVLPETRSARNVFASYDVEALGPAHRVAALKP